MPPLEGGGGRRGAIGTGWSPRLLPVQHMNTCKWGVKGPGGVEDMSNIGIQIQRQRREAPSPSPAPPLVIPFRGLRHKRNGCAEHTLPVMVSSYGVLYLLFELPVAHFQFF